MLEIMFPCATETRAGDTTASSINKYAHFLEKKKEKKKKLYRKREKKRLKTKKHKNASVSLLNGK